MTGKVIIPLERVFFGERQRVLASYRGLSAIALFREPRPTQVYLETYGGFLIHCGATAMGCPGEEDTHPLHGELPNASYQKAWLVIGEDERGAYIGLSGEYQHTVAFTHNYVAPALGRPSIDSSDHRPGLIDASLLLL